MRRLASLGLVLLVGCTTTVVQSGASTSPSPSCSTPLDCVPTDAPDSIVFNYYIEARGGQLSITYGEGDGTTTTVRSSDSFWDRAVEVPNPGTVSLRVEADIFNVIDSCEVDSYALLNPLKGKVEAAGKGWICTIPTRDVSW